jgi:hypothetical protein
MTVNSTSYTATLTNTSTVAQGIWGYYVQPWHLYIGQPVTGTNIPAGTTYQGLNRYVPYNPGFWDANLSQAATGTGSQTLTFGGAIYAAPAGTTVTFLAGTGTIVGCDTACNTASTYLIDASYTLGGGSTVYAIDTPATVYVTAGPRPLHTQKLLWSSDFLFGSVIQKVYGTSQSQQTVIIGETGIRQPSNAIATAGKFWTIPTGVLRQVQSTLAYNTIDGFGVGVSSMCQPTNNPGSSCGKLLDTFNNVGHDIVGNLVTGNNSSGSQYFSNTYTSSFYTDVLELASVGSAYFGTMHLSIDNSFTSYGPIGFSCGTNQSVLYGAYLSGAEWSYSCPPTNMPMIGQMTVPGTPLIHGDTWQTTADSTQTSVARKVGWNGITLGTNANTDAGGVLTLSGGTASYAFTYDYNAAPICGVMQDITTPANTATTTVVVTNKKLTINGTGTDQIGYFCFGRN